MLNKVMIQGRLTADPELRHTHTSQIPVTSFAVAVDRRFFNDRPRETDFFYVVAWQATAEYVCRNFIKGQPVVIEGRLQQRKYTDNQGQTQYVVEIVAESVHFAGFLKNDIRNSNADNIAPFDPYEGQVAAAA
jgi:single-strand DNA-binding protein